MKILFILQLIFFCQIGTAGDTTKLTKQDALVLIRENGYKWKQTDLLVEDASAKKMQAGSALLPHISLEARQYGTRINQLEFGFSNPGDLNFITIGSTSIQVLYSILDTESVHRLNAATYNESMNDALRKQYQSDLTYVMLLQFLNVQKLVEKIHSLDQAILKDQEILKLAQIRINTGLGINLDLVRAKTLLASDQLKKLDAEINYRKSSNDLGVTIGTKDHKDLEPLSYHQLPDSEFKYNLDLVKSEKNELTSANLGIDATNEMVNSAKAQRNPKISLFSEGGILGSYIFGGEGQAFTASVGVQLSLPLFSGNLITGKIKEEEAKRDNAVLQKNQIESTLQDQIDLALAQIKETTQAVDISNQLVELSTDNLKLTHRKFDSGSISNLEIETARTELASALDNRIEAIFSYEVSKINYFKAIGSFDRYFKLEEKWQN